MKWGYLQLHQQQNSSVRGIQDQGECTVNSVSEMKVVDMMFNIAEKQITVISDHQLWNWLFSCKFVTLTDRVDRVIGVKATFSVANLDSVSLWLSESESGSSTAKEEKKPLKIDKLKSISPVSSTADPTDYKHQIYLLFHHQFGKNVFLICLPTTCNIISLC